MAMSHKVCLNSLSFQYLSPFVTHISKSLTSKAASKQTTKRRNCNSTSIPLQYTHLLDEPFYHEICDNDGVADSRFLMFFRRKDLNILGEQ